MHTFRGHYVLLTAACLVLSTRCGWAKVAFEDGRVIALQPLSYGYE